MQNSYYWSDEWSEEFYIELARAGFITTTYDTKDGLVLLPELQYDYAVLDFEELHISKKVKKLLREDRCELHINSRFDEVLDRFSIQHKYNWLKENYVELLKNLYANNDKREDFKLISIELVCKESGELIAGEVGYKIEKTYTSLSGFSSKEKRYVNCGTLQLVLLAQYLQKNDFEFWNLGHPHMEYKKRLGCKIYTRSEFLKRWSKAVNPS
jgi:Leu/Phe-tRNA-protein transferase